MSGLSVVLVTDPLCSWCWGMADEFEAARASLGDEVDFELMLGGINTHGTQPIGDYGRRFMRRLWQEVAATTGQQFGELVVSDYVHNSVLPCLAIEAVAELLEHVPFEYLHELQRLFFTQALDINDRHELLDVAQRMYPHLDSDSMAAMLSDPGLLERVRFQFEHARSFGTQALPNLLVKDVSGHRLLAGGFVDAPMLETLVRAQLG